MMLAEWYANLRGDGGSRFIDDDSFDEIIK